MSDYENTIAELDLLDTHGISIIITRGIDGALVIFVDTNEELLPCNYTGPNPLRILINDEPTYENPTLILKEDIDDD